MAVLNSVVCLLPAVCLAAPGDRDTTFGTAGLVTTDFASDTDRALAVAIQGDGKIVAAGHAYVRGIADSALARYLDGAAVCGNGNVEPGETCDDGNTIDGDGCSSFCVVESDYLCIGDPGQVAKLLASDATNCDRCGDAFGRSVSIDGDLIAIGAPDGLGLNPTGPLPGATYIFRREGLGWIQEAKIVPDDAQPDDGIGKVAISGDRVLMGAVGHDALGNFAGAAYIFRREGITWVQEAKLTAGDADGGDTFGIGLCLRGDMAVVGAWGDDEAGASAGAAYVFRREDNGTPLDPSDDFWAQEAKLIPDDAVTGDLFGIDCSISGNRVVVGATECNPGQRCGLPGKAYVFRTDGINWVQEAKLTASDGAPDDDFGGRVAIDGNSILVGAWFHDSACPNNPECNSGAVYSFIDL